MNPGVTEDAHSTSTVMAESEMMVMSLSFTDRIGNMISHAPMHEEFRINLLAEDLRGDADTKGVMSAFANVSFNAELIDVTSIVPVFDDFSLGTISGATIVDLGGLSVSGPSSPGPQLVAYLNVVALERGELSINIGPGSTIFAENQLFGIDGDVRSSTKYRNGQVTIAVTGDANADGVLNNLDITGLISAISIGGPTDDPHNQASFDLVSPDGCFICADANHDGKVDNLDISGLLRRLSEQSNPSHSMDLPATLDVLTSVSAMFQDMGRGTLRPPFTPGEFLAGDAESDPIISWLAEVNHRSAMT